MTKKKYLFCGLFFFLLALFTFWNLFFAWKELFFQVQEVIDGDTIVVVSGDNSIKHRVRIYGIDAPEWGENNGPLDCFGEESTDWLSGKIKTQEVLLKTKGDRDIHDRLLAYVFYQNQDIGLNMIQDGYAQHLRRFPHAAYDKYQREEDLSRSQKKGLWAVCES